MQGDFRPGDMALAKYDHYMCDLNRNSRLDSFVIRCSRPILIVATLWSDQRVCWLALVLVDDVIGWTHQSLIERI